MKKNMGIGTRSCLAAALALALAVGGCKKEPAPAAPPAKTSVTAAKGTADKGAADKGTPAEPGKTGATGETPEKKAPEGGASAESPTGRAAEAPTSAPIVVPADVAAYGGIRGLDDFVTQTTTVVDQIKPVPGLGLLFSAGIAKTFGVGGVDWLDTSKPIRVAIANPKDSPKPAVIAFPMKSREALEKALPAEREAGADGAAFKYKAGSNDAWISFAGDSVIFARDPKVLTRLQPFVAGPLASWSPTDAFELKVSIANLTTMFAPEIEKVRAKVTEKVAGRAADIPFPEVAEWLQKAVTWTFATVAELDTATLGVRIDGDHVMFPLTLHAKAGSALEKTFTGEHGRALTLLDYAPATSWFAIGASGDPKAGAGWSEIAIALLAEGMKLPAEDKAKLLGLVKTSSELQTGETAIALSRDGSMSLAALVVGSTKDGAKLREAMLGATSMLWSKGAERVAAEKGPIPPGVDISTFQKAIESVGVLAAPVGVTMTLGSEPHADGPVDFLTIKVDYTKMPVAQGDPQEIEVLKSVIGDTITIALGFGKERYALAIGPDATARVGAVIDGKTAGAPAVRTTVSHAVPGACFLAYLSLTDALKAFASLPDFKEKREVIAAMTAAGGSAISVGSAPRNGLQLILDISLPDMQQMMKLQ